MAARYRKIDPRIWTDVKFRQLTGGEQLIAVYMLIAQLNRIGLVSISPGKACEDLGMLPQTFKKCLFKICQTLNWSGTNRHGCFTFPTWWRFKAPENANNMIGNLKDFNDLRETPRIAADR